MTAKDLFWLDYSKNKTEQCNCCGKKVDSVLEVVEEEGWDHIDFQFVYMCEKCFKEGK